MKEKSYIKAISATSALLILLTGSAGAKTVTITDSKSFKESVESLNNGDVLMIKPGTYNLKNGKGAELKNKKNITIQSKGAGVIIDGGKVPRNIGSFDLSNAGLRINNCNGITVRGLTFQNLSGPAVLVNRGKIFSDRRGGAKGFSGDTSPVSEDINIESIVAKNVQDAGFTASLCTKLEIRNCTIETTKSRTGEALSISVCDDFKIINNKINNGQGIGLVAKIMCQNGDITGNTILKSDTRSILVGAKATQRDAKGIDVFGNVTDDPIAMTNVNAKGGFGLRNILVYNNFISSDKDAFSFSSPDRDSAEPDVIEDVKLFHNTAEAKQDGISLKEPDMKNFTVKHNIIKAKRRQIFVLPSLRTEAKGFIVGNNLVANKAKKARYASPNLENITAKNNAEFGFQGGPAGTPIQNRLKITRSSKARNKVTAPSVNIPGRIDYFGTTRSGTFDLGAHEL